MPEHLWVDHLASGDSCLGVVPRDDVAIMSVLGRRQKILWRHGLHFQNVGVAPLSFLLLKRECVREIHRQECLGEFDPVAWCQLRDTEERMSS